MRKQIYLAIIERLKCVVKVDGVIQFIPPEEIETMQEPPERVILHFSLWNNNLEKLEQEKGYRFPAIFIEFEVITWEQMGNRTMSGDARIRLHIVTHTLTTPEDGSLYQGQALEYFDLLDAVGAAMQGFAGMNFNGFQLVESLTDHEHPEDIYHNEECFVTRITNTSAVRKPTKLQNASISIKTTT